MTAPSAGLHHITAICGDPAENRRFFVDVLGLRLVKKTVNFDDPGTYHLYYGDEVGTPGSALTFFAFAGAPRGQHGLGAAAEIAFAVPNTQVLILIYQIFIKVRFSPSKIASAARYTK